MYACWCVCMYILQRRTHVLHNTWNIGSCHKLHLKSSDLVTNYTWNHRILSQITLESIESWCVRTARKCLKHIVLPRLLQNIMSYSLFIYHGKIQYIYIYAEKIIHTMLTVLQENKMFFGTCEGDDIVCFVKARFLIYAY
jgi:hypothetical protein